MSKVMRALGLMSGTSLDGIDVALLETDGGSLVRRGRVLSVPYDAALRSRLKDGLRAARGLSRRDERPAPLVDLEREVTDRHVAAIDLFRRTFDVAPSDIDIVGFHGQTVLHRPEARLTVQLGLGQDLADRIQIPVVFDLRAADVAAGGHGAPLVPVYHRALIAALPQRPIAIINIGGVANVTWIGRDGRLIAFDTGPGNALIDDWMRAHAGRDFDEGGALAQTGRIHRDIVHVYLSNPYFAAMPPKSLDRDAFGLEAVNGLMAEDGAATLAAVTAGSIAKAREHMPEEPELWIISGGGRRNRTIMRLLAGSVHHAVVPAEAVGLDGDGLEAEAWAYLAVRSHKGLPITYPDTTGVAAPMTGGITVVPRCR